MSDISVVIKSIGRKTLIHAMESSLREGFKTIVILDGKDPDEEVCNYKGIVNIIRLPKNWGHYGFMAANVGVAYCTTEYVAFLDDDDEFIKGAGGIVRRAISEKNHADILISGVRQKERLLLQFPDKSSIISRNIAVYPDKGLVPGNVAMPIYKTHVFEYIPFTKSKRLPPEYADFEHVESCKHAGYEVDWIGEIVYLVRPKLQGSNGQEDD